MIASVASVLIMAGCVSAGGPEFGQQMDFGRPARPTPRAQAYARYLSGTFLENQGKYEASLKELEQVPQLDPKAISPTLRLIRAHLRQRDYDQALAMAERAVEQAPKQSNLWVVLGEIYHQLNRYDDATKAFTKSIELNPDNVLGYGALVELQENTNDLVSAIDIYQRLIQLNPQSAGLHYQLGINLIRINDSAAAREELRKALELSSSLVRAHYFLGVLALEAGDVDESISRLKQYLTARADDREAEKLLASALARKGDYAEALKLYQKQLNSSEVQPKDHLAASFTALQAEQPELAEKLLPPDGAPIVSTLVQAMARSAQNLPYQPLLDTLDTVEGDLQTELDAYLRDLLYLFGRESAGQKLLDTLHHFEASTPGSRTLKMIEARTYMALDRTDESIKLLESMLAQEPANEWVHYFLGVVYDKQKDFQNTELHLKAYLEKRPDDPEALNFLAYLYAEAGVKLEEAEDLLKRALAADPENPYYLDSLGWVYFKKGQADEAISYIQQAIYRMNTDDATLRDHLGDAYLLKGDAQRAVAEWERALRLDPNVSGVKEKLEKRAKPAGGVSI